MPRPDTAVDQYPLEALINTPGDDHDAGLVSLSLALLILYKKTDRASIYLACATLRAYHQFVGSGQRAQPPGSEKKLGQS
jgi:hypothetical protein